VRERERERKGQRDRGKQQKTSYLPAGWQRPIGYIKVQVIFWERALNCRVLLREIPVKIKNPMGLRHPVLLG